MEHLLPYTHEPGVGILAPRRLMEGQIFTNDFQKVNLSNPFASMYQQKLKKQVVNGPVDICGTAFEGLCISRKAVAEIGLPNKELFIFVTILITVCVQYWQASGFYIFPQP